MRIRLPETEWGRYEEEDPMKYMLLVHHDEEAFAKRDESERQQLLKESVQLANRLHSDGKYLSAAPLHPSSETVCVQVRNSKRLVTDGPFAETHEQLGGFFLLECQDLDEALRWAEKIPHAKYGSVEVRPLWSEV